MRVLTDEEKERIKSSISKDDLRQIRILGTPLDQWAPEDMPVLLLVVCAAELRRLKLENDIRDFVSMKKLT